MLQSTPTHLKLGEAEKWTICSAADRYPFHIHVNSLLSLNDWGGLQVRRLARHDLGREGEPLTPYKRFTEFMIK